MAYRSSTFAALSMIACYVAPIFVTLYSALDAFFRAVMLVAAPFAWRSARDLCLVAYRKIADLKPVYRESYDTHGLSLDVGRLRN
jgi:hypothetical protein